MKEVRKTIIVATLAAALLKLEAMLPIDHAAHVIDCLRTTAPAGALYAPGA